MLLRGASAARHRCCCTALMLRDTGAVARRYCFSDGAAVTMALQRCGSNYFFFS